MEKKLTISALLICALSQCTYLLKSEPNYTEIKDDQGRLIEKYGNENSWDNDFNFHSFYFYNDKGQLIKERVYSTDSTYQIKDTTNYFDIAYTYDWEGNRDKKIKVMANFDSSGSIVGRDTIYITDLKTNQTIYPKSKTEQ